MIVPVAHAASKPHVMSFGKPTTVKMLLGPSEEKSLTISVRPLFLDTKLKEYTTGPAHDVTDRVFVVRRAYRVNDSLPTESSRPLAVATRRLAAGRSQHWAHHATQTPRLRPVLLRCRLVSRLRRLLRGRRRRQPRLCHRRPDHHQEASLSRKHWRSSAASFPTLSARPRCGSAIPPASSSRRWAARNSRSTSTAALPTSPPTRPPKNDVNCRHLEVLRRASPRC